MVTEDYYRQQPSLPLPYHAKRALMPSGRGDWEAEERLKGFSVRSLVNR